MGTLSGETTLSFSFLPSFSMGVNFSRKELAPLGANAFLYKVDPFSEVFIAQGSK